jgi:hypothetical protein
MSGAADTPNGESGKLSLHDVEAIGEDVLK